MDALNNLINNIPAWQQRLEELSGQIDKRQAELAALADTKCSAEAEVRSLRNKGSTESLKPTDDGPLHMGLDESTQPSRLPMPAQNAPAKEDRQIALKAMAPKVTSPTAEGSSSPTEPASQPDPLAGRPQPQPQPQPQPPRTRKRAASVASVDNHRSIRLTRNMIIVYYDSYVQGFFDEMVRFISLSRNLMRKANMAAKVAQIKRFAEADLSGEKSPGADDKASLDALPSLRLINNRQYGIGGLRSGQPGVKNASNRPGAPPNIYDHLDKALEFVQSTCEHGAHQFLRDANCNDELRKIQQRMAEVLETAKKEVDRIAIEEPELAKEADEIQGLSRKRSMNMTRYLVANSQDGHQLATDNLTGSETEDPASKSPPLPATGRIEVDFAVSAIANTNTHTSWSRMPHQTSSSADSTRHRQVIAAE